MTSPLPAQNSKPTLGESKNAQQGGFLNFCASPKNTETPSFESLISQNEQRQERQDELEEAEAAKKRKKAADAAAIAAQASTSGNIQSEPCLDLTQDPLQLLNAESTKLAPQSDLSNQLPSLQNQSAISTSSETPTASETTPSDLENVLRKTDAIDSQTQKEENAASTLENVQDKDSDAQQTTISEIEDSEDSANGMKTATREDDMVSLATFEDTQASATPKVASEPAITSANRLSTMALLSERTAISSTENAGSGADTSSGNFATGNPALIASNGNNSVYKTAESQASSLLKTLAPELEKFQQTGKSQIQLELPVGENESVKIRLNLRAGEIRSTFITESPELREALQKAWPDFTATHRSQGIRFGESQFQDSFARQQDATSDQGRQRQHQTETFVSDIPSKQQTKNSPRSVQQALGNSQASPSSIHLWA
jgi:flagellar hook-length control protein FliK